MFREQSSWSERSSPSTYVGPWPNTGVPERWASMPEYPDYDVSDQGRVRSWKRGGAPKILQPVARRGKWDGRQAGRGHLSVGITARDGKRRFPYVHVLVAKAFIPNPEGRTQVAHNDSDPTNCRAGNLRWATPPENAADKKVRGTNTCAPLRGRQFTVPEVMAVKVMLREGVSCIAIAKLYRCTAAAIWAIASGRSWSKVKI